jgi:hypothetical protein
LPARHPGEDQQAKQAAGSDSQEMAELRRRSQAMEDALRDVMSIGEGGSMVTGETNGENVNFYDLISR